MITDILPDRWSEVSRYRENKLRNSTLMDGTRMLNDACVSCPLCRVYNFNFRIEIVACVFNKCIKRYPHRVDNDEFR